MKEVVNENTDYQRIIDEWQNLKSLRALTMNQPWATLLARGIKKIETRSFMINHVGLIAIYATKNLPAEAKQMFYGYPFNKYLHDFGTADQMPRGGIIGLGYVEACRKIKQATHPLYGVNGMFIPTNGWDVPVAFEESHEYQFGYYDVGRTITYLPAAFEFSEIIETRPTAGMAQIWKVEDSALQKIKNELQNTNYTTLVEFIKKSRILNGGKVGQ